MVYDTIPDIPAAMGGPERSKEIPLISVIIPVYNVSRYLSQCLESVIGQTYQDLEIILIDDGSDDGSGSICDSFARRDARIRVLRTKNRGLASARNTGLENAGGDYLSFIDSDDWVEPHAIETLLTAAIRYKADVVAAQRCVEYVGQTVQTEYKEKNVRICRGRDILSAYADKSFYNFVWNKLYEISWFSGRRFPSGRNFEDIPVTCKLMKDLAENSGTVVIIPDELFHFRMRKSSISHSWSLRNIMDCWAAYHGRFESLPDYQDAFLERCIRAAGRMWKSYCGFTEEERRQADGLIIKMQYFSKAHFRQVMNGSYSRSLKLISLITQWKSPPVMWLCFYGIRLRRLLKKPGYALFE